VPDDKIDGQRVDFTIIDTENGHADSRADLARGDDSILRKYLDTELGPPQPEP
jgi:hypothetical protein